MPLVTAVLTMLLFANPARGPEVWMSEAFVQNIDQRQTTDVSFVYFGTKDCSVCRRFVRHDLRTVKNIAQAAGIGFTRKEIGSLRNILMPGSFGKYDALAKTALKQAGINAVPLFAVVSDGRLVDAHAGKWRDLLRVAVEMKR